MGQSKSFPHREPRRSLLSLRSSMSSKSKKHSMSATFNILEQNTKVELLNINVASEEELMTLAGVTREIARNIVQYRRVIGRFKRVDDLALVPGIGAEKLHSIRSEVCVRRQKNTDVSLSVNSLDSIASSEISTTSRSIYVDINRASVFELQTVEGITQEIAANIVHHREKRGPFKTVYELRKVKGIDRIRFSVMRARVTINDDEQFNKFKPNGSKNTRNGFVIGNEFAEDISTECNTKVKPNSNNSLTPYMSDIFDLLSTYSPRPVVETFKYERNGKKSIRICSWNLYNLTSEKAENPGFLEVCCRTILENRFTIVAIQDICDKFALKLICDELNEPTLKRIIEWKDNSRSWKYFSCLKTKSSEHLGFIYNSNAGGIDTELISVENITSDENVGEAALVKFEVEESSLSLLNIHIKNECASLLKLIHDNLRNKTDTVVLGDFSELFSDENVGTDPNIQNNSFILPYKTNTSSTKDLKNSVAFFDNICLSLSATNRYTGFGNMIEDGLMHLAIPRGWTWGGVVSEHCPVWCELYIGDLNERTALIDLPSNGTIICNGTD